METLAEQLKAFSDPTRLRIVRLLEYGELCVCDLMEALDLPQSKVSRHMSFLKNAGWVASRRNGKWVYYSLAAPEGAIQSGIMVVLRQGLPQVLQAQEDYQRLCNYLETKNPETCD